MTDESTGQKRGCGRGVGGGITTWNPSPCTVIREPPPPPPPLG